MPHALTVVHYRCQEMLFVLPRCSVSWFPSMKRLRDVQCAAGLYWQKNRFRMGLNGGLLHRWGSVVGGAKPLHSSYECVSLCHIDALFPPRANGRKSAEHRTRRYTAAGNFDCKLHQTPSTAHTCSRNYVAIWDLIMTMFYFTPRLGGYRGGVLERFLLHWERNCCHSQWM